MRKTFMRVAMTSTQLKCHAQYSAKITRLHWNEFNISSDNCHKQVDVCFCSDAVDIIWRGFQRLFFPPPRAPHSIFSSLFCHATICSFSQTYFVRVTLALCTRPRLHSFNDATMQYFTIFSGNFEPFVPDRWFFSATCQKNENYAPHSTCWKPNWNLIKSVFNRCAVEYLQHFPFAVTFYNARRAKNWTWQL